MLLKLQASACTRLINRGNVFNVSFSDPDEPPTRDVTSPSKSGVAYLTENLIKRLTKVENIAQITTLHVTLGKDLNKKIKVSSKEPMLLTFLSPTYPVHDLQ